MTRWPSGTKNHYHKGPDHRTFKSQHEELERGVALTAGWGKLRGGRSSKPHLEIEMDQERGAGGVRKRPTRAPGEGGRKCSGNQVILHTCSPGGDHNKKTSKRGQGTSKRR